jgi:hypothetical protein
MFSIFVKPVLWTIAATVLYAGLALAIFQVETKSTDNTVTGSISQK